MDPQTPNNTFDDLKKLADSWNNGSNSNQYNPSHTGSGFLPQTYFPQAHPCPTCGSCPTCGRAARRVITYGYPGYYWAY